MLRPGIGWNCVSCTVGDCRAAYYQRDVVHCTPYCLWTVRDVFQDTWTLDPALLSRLGIHRPPWLCVMYSRWLLSERCSSLHVYKCTRGRDILACKMLSAFRKALKSNFLFYPVCMYERMSEGIPWREGRLTHCVRFYLRTALQNRGTSNLHQCCLCCLGDGLYHAIMSGVWIQ